MGSQGDRGRLTCWTRQGRRAARYRRRWRGAVRTGGSASVSAASRSAI